MPKNISTTIDPLTLANKSKESFDIESGKEKKFNFNSVAVVGLGYVGLPLALQIDKKGLKTIGVEVSDEKVKKINSKESPFFDGRFKAEIESSNLEASTDFSVIENVEVVVICVPTPVDENSEPDLRPLMSACKSVSNHLTKNQLIIVESTINPGVSEENIIPVLEEGSGLKAGIDFSIAHCPERINPGDEFWSVSNIPRVVGSLDSVGLQKAVDFYESVIDAKIKPMSSLKEAEAVKIIENCFRDINIAFVNELAMSFSNLGIDVIKVIEGASTKPFAFMPHFPGCGVGGHCIPVDPNYLIKYAESHGFEHKLLKVARSINNDMPEFSVNQVVQELEKLGVNINGVKISVLGLSYKSDIDDTRESPSFEIIEKLRALGAEVVTYDPFVAESDVDNLDKALDGSSVVVLTTGHSEFKKISKDFFEKNKIKLVFDGRNVLDKDSFVGSSVVYKGIGR